MTEIPALEHLRRTALESPEVMTLVMEGKKISAVQLLMAKTGAGISAAKTAIELLETGGTAAPVSPPAPPTVAEGIPQAATPPPPTSTPVNGLNLPGRAVQPEERPRADAQPAPAGTAWLKNWKGRSHKTKKQILNAACQACGHAYQLRAAELNELASQMGGLNKFMRGVDIAWALSNSGSQMSSRAGKQLQFARAEADMDKSIAARNNAYVACLCPQCRSDEVLVESPR